MKKGIAFWAAPPPPIGGMTVHVQRLSHVLEESGWEIQFYDFGAGKRYDPRIKAIPNLPLFLLTLPWKKSPQVHYVISTRAHVRFILSLFGKFCNRKVVLRVGGRSLEEGLTGNKINRWMSKVALKNCSAFIGVNDEICDLARTVTSSEKVHSIPGYIPPNDLPVELPVSIQNFIDPKKKLILVTGQLASESEEDIYGLWDVLKMAKGLDPSQFQLLIVTYSFSKSFESRVLEYRERIERLGLSDHILLYYNEDELWPLIKAADLFMRPSHTDGDSNALREALDLDCICLASDAVRRPEGNIIFKTGDVADMIEKTSAVLEGRLSAPKRTSSGPGNAQKIETLLNALL